MKKIKDNRFPLPFSYILWEFEQAVTVEFFVFMKNMWERGEFEFQWESLG